MVVRPSHRWINGKRMAAAFSSSTAIARMAVEGAPAWELATLMPDGAVGASASGGRAVVQDALSLAVGDGGVTLTNALTQLSGEDREARLNLDDEAPDASVAALVDGVVGRHDVAQRWSELKARALGLERHLDEARDVAAATAA